MKRIKQMKHKNILNRSKLLISISTLCMLVAGCGSDNIDDFFMVTNTLQGHVCVNRLDIAHDMPEAKVVARNLYAYYGYEKGETQILSGKYIPCSQAKAYGSRSPDIIIYAEDYRNIIVPAVMK
jgi:hypothetical protein